MPRPNATPGASSPRPIRAWILGLIVAAVATVVFGWRLDAEPLFVDETAYVTQAYFFDLLIQGRRDDWAWVEYHGYDLPPLPKYLIGAALKLHGDPIPNRLDAMRWFGNPRQKLVPDALIHHGRWPSVPMGAVGCVAIFALGTMVRDRRTGLMAAALLMVDPLYRMHARRAMSDVPAEAMILATAAVGLWAWRGTLEGTLRLPARLLAAPSMGVLGGLAVLSKLNGGLALMILGTWAMLAIGLERLPWRRRLTFVGLSAIAGVVSLATFILLNPFVTAHPTGPAPINIFLPASIGDGVPERLRWMLRHRTSVSLKAQADFSHNALPGPSDKVIAVAAQGFGRFSPLGPQDHDSLKPMPRVSWDRDRSAFVWIAWVVVGAVVDVRRGLGKYRDGRAPADWAIVLQAVVATITVTSFIPLAWDRYFLSLQSGAILLASSAAIALIDRPWSAPARAET